MDQTPSQYQASQSISGQPVKPRKKKRMGGKGTKEDIEKESEVQAINSLINENFDPRNCTPEPMVNLSHIISETKIVTRNGDEIGEVHNHNTLNTRTSQNSRTKPNTDTDINNIKPNTEAIDSTTPLCYDINLMDSDPFEGHHLNIRERNINPEIKTRKGKIRIKMIKTILTPLMLGLVTGVILTMGYYSQFGMAATTKCGHVYKSEISHTSESWPPPNTFSSPLPPSSSSNLTFLQPPGQATADSDTTQLPGSTVDTKTTVTTVTNETTAPIQVKRNTTAPIPMKRITTATIPVTPAPVPDIPTTTAPIQPPGSSTPVETTTTTDRTTRYNVVIKAYMDW